jgi:hypothetical protein
MNTIVETNQATKANQARVHTVTVVHQVWNTEAEEWVDVDYTDHPVGMCPPIPRLGETAFVTDRRMVVVGVEHPETGADLDGYYFVVLKFAPPQFVEALEDNSDNPF